MKQQATDILFGKVPPQDINAELAVVSACLVEPDIYEDLQTIIKSAECFYKAEYQTIWRSMGRVVEHGSRIDILTVTNDLRKHDELELIGGAYFIMQTAQAVTSTANVVDHARIVFEKFMYREIIRISATLVTQAYKGSDDAFELLELAQNGLKTVLDGVGGDSGISISDSYRELLFDLEEQMNSENTILGIPSCIKELDELTQGWQDTDLIILGARPSVGKTAFAVNFARSAALWEDKKTHVLFFSLEASDVQLTRRIAAALCKIPLQAIRTGKVTPNEYNSLMAAVSTFGKMSIRFEVKARKIETICRIAKKWADKLPPDDKKIIVVDYMQLIKVTGKGNREQEISTVSRELKELAMLLGLPVIALSQLNRAIETRTDKKPQLSDLRESGSIEQDANIVIFPYYVENSDGTKELHAHIAKNRDGQCGDIVLKMNGDMQLLMSITDDEPSVTPSGAAYLYDNPRAGIDNTQRPVIDIKDCPF